MPAIINTNMASLNSQRHLSATQLDLFQAMQRLSSGKRINNARDDAAGLGIAARMGAQITGMNQGIRNARDGISLGQTAEGALSTMNEMLQRIRVLAVQSSNATNSPSDRQALQNEVGQLVAELNRLAETTTFNNQYLLNGTLGTQYFQVGPNANELIGANGANFLTEYYGNYRTVQDGVDPKRMLSPAPPGEFPELPGKSGGLVRLTGYQGAEELTITGNDTARTIVEKINKMVADTGITATAKTTAFLELEEGKTYSFQLRSNNIKTDPAIISFAVGDDISLNDSFAAAINAINAQTAKTGVTAEYDPDNQGIRLANANGNDIVLSNTLTSSQSWLYSYDVKGHLVPAGGQYSGTSADGDGAVAFGTVTLDSPYGFVAEEVNPLSDSEEYPIAGPSGTATGELMRVSDLDVSTFEKAQKALAIVDSAIVHIVGEMARFGALQARFEATILNLEVNSENTSNAKSRIMDADYAQETSSLARSTILQQAGIAMLSQANQMPQMVLNLIG